MKARDSKPESAIILPPPTANRNDGLPPFLKVTNISEKGITQITLLGVWRKSNSRFGEGIEVTCKINNKKYIWTIRFDSPDRPSPNYCLLFGRFGSDIKKWKGIVNVERKEYMGNPYVAVVG